MAERRGSKSRPRGSRAKGRTSVDQFITVQRRVQEARDTDAIELDLGDLSKLKELPPELAGLTALQSLNLRGTQISDLSHVAGLTALRSLDLDGTRISDLAPLAGLTALETLHLSGTKVSDLTPLADLTALQNLDLDGTQVSDLAPLAGLAALETLHLSGTKVSDLTPLADLAALGTLDLQGTRVHDLAPLAELTVLQDWVSSHDAMRLRVAWGLRYARTPVAQGSPFDQLVRLKQPERTVETINEVRRRQDLPEHIPEGYERPAHLDEELLHRPPSDQDEKSDAETAAALEQRPATYSFPYTGERFRAKAQISRPADLALATDIHAELKNKALESRDRLLRSNAPKRVRETIDRLLADLGVTVGDVSPGKLLMRSRSLDADVAAYDTVEARREIAEDALAQVIDVAASVTDLKSCYPAITRLEAARVAQDLLTKDVSATLDQMSAIRQVAAASEVVDPSAVEALKVGIPEIEHADEIIADKAMGDDARVIATEKRAETAAQMLLDHRNFVASVLKTVSGLYETAKPTAVAIATGVATIATKTGQAVVKKAPGPLSDAAVATCVGALAGAVLGPTAGLAAFLATYKPLAKKASQFVKAATELAKSVRRKQSGGPDDDSTDEVDASNRC